MAVMGFGIAIGIFIYSLYVAKQTSFWNTTLSLFQRLITEV